ncbi:signal peptidase II [Salinivibrio costicola]|uniref:Lipoprotein signal peptidase n=1 Tax=Salinivibrio costicola TaxID=51367 RepID=A0ABX6K9J8_SALCS|nr:signal peptidase II [Salinivibrio costicola]QIR06891.1 lipoprotein signal peptidase [Salinivibrio costicola]
MTSHSLSQSGWRWLWLAPLVFVLDIGSKWLVMNTMGYGPANRIELLPFFNLTYVHNHGAAFSFLSDAGGWQRWLFSVIALGVSGLLTYWMRVTPASKRMLNIAYAMIIGGALGNLFDRLVHGYVIDFLDFFIGNSHWPAFNLADSAICVGAVLVVLDSFRHEQSSAI